MKMSCDDNPKLKILFIAGWYPSEDNPISGIFIKEHAKAVSIYNDVVVLHSRQSNSPAKNRLEIFDEVEDGMRTIRIKHSKSPIPKITRFIHLYSVWKIFRKLLKEKWKPDIIHAHLYWAGVAGVLLGRMYKIPVIITEHHSGFPRHLLGRRALVEAKFALRRAKIILAVSGFLKRSIESYDIKNRFEIVPNVVDTDLFHPDEQIRKDANVKRILLVALLSPIKGLPNIFEAISNLRQKREDFCLDIIGDGPNRKEYEELTFRLGINDKVHFHGLKSKQEVAQFMRESCFFVLPSLMETFGVVLIEALASGIPVIAGNIGGQKEIVTKDVGLLTEPHEVSSLADTIDYMLDHYQDYSTEKICQYAKDKFSYEVVGKKLDDIYRQVGKL